METKIESLGICGIVPEDWEEGKEYRRNVLTTDYETWITYISRKAVPKGIPLGDSEYWKPICRLRTDIAAEFNQVRSDVEALKENVDSLIVDKDKLYSYIDEINKELNVLIDAVRQLTVLQFDFEFYLGFTDDYEEIINDDHKIKVEGTTVGQFTVVNDNHERNVHLVLVIDKIFGNLINRISFGGMTVPTVRTETDEYIIFTSVNLYDAGVYVVDINR